MNAIHRKLTSDRKFLVAMIAIAVTLLIDTSFVKTYDLIDKNSMPVESRLLLFSVNTSVCILLQFFVIKHMMSSILGGDSRNMRRVNSLHIISLISVISLGIFVGLIIFQLFYFGFYDTWINMLTLSVSYGVSALLIIRLGLFFVQWYGSNHDLIVLLYFISMCLISFNLILTALYVDFKLTYAQQRVGQFVGGGGDISGGKNMFLVNVYYASSLMSFFSIWVTTAIMMSSYREKLIRSLRYWIVLLLPLMYFLVTNYYQIFLVAPLNSYFQDDPITASIILTSILSLSKPIGGLLFAIAFWNISRKVKYVRKMKLSMIIAGWGIFFIFSANQASSQVYVHYPPFGIATMTIMNMGAYFMVLGIYRSATLVSINNNLRSHIHKNTLKLLNPIGRAEMDREIQKTVLNISQNQEITKISKDESFEFDENELKKYINDVIKFKKEISTK